MNTYARLPLRLVGGEGCWLTADDGRRFLDGLSGIGVCSLGHSHPEITAAIADQAGTLLHAANLTHLPLQEQLADRLGSITGMDSAFFCNSGAEANECAIKIARMYAHQRGIEQPLIAVATGSFHGRTMACLSATDSSKVQHGFEPLLDGFIRVPFGDMDALQAVAEAHPNLVAVLVEPILGEGGVVVPEDGFLSSLRALCDRHELLMMLDEVQTGVAKTGDWFAFQHDALRPDVLCTAKALGNGVPIGACLADGRASSLLTPGKHGSTFGGNPLACRAALTVLDIIERQALLTRAEVAGRRLRGRLREGLQQAPHFVEVRGRGLMIGVVFDQPCGDLVQQALDRGVIINVTRDNVVRLLPPLVASDSELDQLADTVIECGQALVS
jgi:acetylornithine aminotransferase